MSWGSVEVEPSSAPVRQLGQRDGVERGGRGGSGPAPAARRRIHVRVRGQLRRARRPLRVRLRARRARHGPAHFRGAHVW